MNEIPTNNPEFFPDGLMENVVTEATTSIECINNNKRNGKASKEQPVEGLEEEIERVCAEIEEKNPQHRGLKPSGIAKIACHFAEWGADHLKK